MGPFWSEQGSTGPHWTEMAVELWTRTPTEEGGADGAVREGERARVGWTV